jgi:cation diffusion facilitator family transporter
VGRHPHSHAHPHSHDHSERVDRALATSRLGLRTLYGSFAVLLVTAAAQALVVVVTGSVALLADTMHNAVDALTAIPLAVAFTIGRRAATRSHTYGFGRAEDLAGLIVVVLIALSAVVAAVESVRRLVTPVDIRQVGAVAGAAVLGFAGNELVARWRITVGRRIGSAALVADGLHARTDGFTSLAVLAAAGGAALGWRWVDPVVGLLVAGLIVAVLVSAARIVLARLMDAVDPATTDLVAGAAAGTPGVRGVRDVRLRWSGHNLLAELTVEVDHAASLTAAHGIAHDAEHRLRRAVPRLLRVHVHLHPVRRGCGDHDRAVAAATANAP